MHCSQWMGRTGGEGKEEDELREAKRQEGGGGRKRRTGARPRSKDRSKSRYRTFGSSALRLQGFVYNWSISGLLAQ